MDGGAIFQTPDVAALSAGLEVLSLRQRLIAQNLANVDTPGYARLDLDFGQAFAAALAAETGTAGSPGATALAGPAGVPGATVLASAAPALPAGASLAGAVQPAAGLAFKVDGNGVDLDQEMVELAETGMQYEAASQLLALAFGRLRTAVTGRS
ncbi:MAG: flagellar biosynthesis protein FlgB [Firmicutes bacterium]|nr:flagellar biosynthesis protein FlgB [Bacillota bacterium]